MACLAFAAYAAGGKPSLAGLTVAYAAARAVGSIPLMPGGLLVVEAVLVPGLVSSGMTLASAISAMLIYRLVSWIFIAAIGWVVFFFMFRTEKDVDPDAALDATADPPEPAADPEAEAPTRLLGRCMPTGIRTIAAVLGVLALTIASLLAVDARVRRRRLSRRRPQPTPRRQDVPVAVTPVLASVVAAPVPVPATDGKNHLAYELQLTNIAHPGRDDHVGGGTCGRPDAADAGRRSSRRTGRASSGPRRRQQNWGPVKPGSCGSTSRWTSQRPSPPT